MHTLHPVVMQLVTTTWHAQLWLRIVATGKAAKEVIGDEAWVTETFIPCIQKRGAAIIAARKLSSALSAAQVRVNAYKKPTMV